MPSLTLILNGQSRTLELEPPWNLARILGELGFKSDRIAVEHNGEIVSRTAWSAMAIEPGDRLEVVHFVGGGLS